jgi:2-hydroxy-3-oxopropionate reductase
METIGFIGVGVMGRPMALNLLGEGYSLAIVSRHPDREAVLIAHGASTAASHQELARISDVIILMLPDTNSVEKVLFAEGGVNSGIRKGSIVVDMSTISPKKTVEFAERLAGTGCVLLDAPVSGGEQGAESGTLGIMAGGPKESFERCRPILEAMGKNIIYTGPCGCGQKTKLVNQLIGHQFARRGRRAAPGARRGPRFANHAAGCFQRCCFVVDAGQSWSQDSQAGLCSRLQHSPAG